MPAAGPRRRRRCGGGEGGGGGAHGWLLGVGVDKLLPRNVCDRKYLPEDPCVRNHFRYDSRMAAADDLPTSSTPTSPPSGSSSRPTPGSPAGSSSSSRLGASLSVQWFEVLIRLARTPGQRLRMSDLAAQTTLSASGLTRAVDRLEAAGLVDREACPTDRRSALRRAHRRGRGPRSWPPSPATSPRSVERARPTSSSPTSSTRSRRSPRRLRDAVQPCAATASEPGGLDD